MYSMDMIPCPRTVPLSDGGLSIQYRRYMDIGHVVWVLIFLILLLVFCNGYVGEYTVAVVWIWTTTAKYHWKKLTAKPLAHSLPLCVYMFMFVCVHLWGRVCVTWHQQLLWHPQLCNFHLHNLASQDCNKRKKWGDGIEGWWGGFGGCTRWVEAGEDGRWGVARVSFGQIPESRHT